MNPIALTVDVEEYFQVTALAPHVARAAWGEIPSRVEASARRLLEIFARHDVHATFFVLGWVAERHPGLVREIVAGGHELASHGYDHTLAFHQDRQAFTEDVRRTKGILEGIAGVGVKGYRATSFSLAPLMPWSHEVLRREGYQYSSSLHPIRHDVYGLAHGPRGPFRPHPEGVVEIPVTPPVWGGMRLPAPGGGFFRLYPLVLTRYFLQRILQVDGIPAVFYLHPWELDPEQPKVAGVGWKSRFRHRLNLGRTEARLESLLTWGAWNRMDRTHGAWMA